MIDAGADLVMGSGPHVLRGFQWYHGHLIAYSLGNFCGYNTLGLDAYTSVSAMLHVTLNAPGSSCAAASRRCDWSRRGSRRSTRTGLPSVTSTRCPHDDFAGNGAAHLSAAGEIKGP